jgi:hypothetical protein
MNIERMDSSLFDWLTWSSGSILEIFNVQHRTPCILASKHLLQKYAVGWCPSEQVPCRPKIGYICVMFLTDDRMWWTHITKEEFNKVFCDETSQSNIQA